MPTIDNQPAHITRPPAWRVLLISFLMCTVAACGSGTEGDTPNEPDVAETGGTQNTDEPDTGFSDDGFTELDQVHWWKYESM